MAKAPRAGPTEEIVDERIDTRQLSMVTETIDVPEIHCGHCKDAIEGALTPLPGVSHAEVSVDAHTVTVEYDDAAIDRQRLLAEIADQGYEVPA